MHGDGGSMEGMDGMDGLNDMEAAGAVEPDATGRVPSESTLW